MQDTMQIINLEEGLSRIRGNKALYVKMLGMFLDNKEIGLFEKNLAENDLAQAADIAHAIKGMTGNLSLISLSAVSSDLIDSLRKGVRDQALIDRYDNILDETFKQVRALKQRLESELGI